MVEIAVDLNDILKVFGWSRSKFFRNREELWDLGIIFYRREGCPPTRKIYAFPSVIQRYIMLQASRGVDI